ncbi:ABC transporter C family protein (macronuclear) [Tetrahymena thermophila SB210]|uniref:ABC transporter C family protein n=1 Tax=Tetrahymena thermophila (strain SB210) TaxID=312017 RepID=I7MK99_TETTS|nr:ABC transporter C family protein [Tetrahymena thermophila SB210]EAR97927.3 ABC transporter C family protein [Tetrahymena thermophila SB210]|eukprot:XP_001018172.3 ABC transporter C family protein [Tetrahymena thermophila SB210]
MKLQQRQKSQIILPSIGDLEKMEFDEENEEIQNLAIQMNTLEKNCFIQNVFLKYNNEFNQQKDILSFESTNTKNANSNDQQKKFNFKMNTSWFSRLFLVDLLKLLLYSRKVIQRWKQIRVEDLPNLDPQEQTCNLNQKFEKNLQKEYEQAKTHGKELGAWSMLITILKTFKGQLIQEYLLLIFMNALKLFSSIAIKNLIDNISDNIQQQDILLWAGIIAASNIAYVLLMHHANKINYCLFSKIRAMFVKSLYIKVSSLSANTIKDANIGKLINLISGDLSSIEYMSYVIMCFTIIPFCLIFVALILYQRFHWYGILGLILMICFIPLQILVANISSKLFAQKSSLVDQRVNQTSEVIEGIRFIKMYGWECAFIKSIKSVRQLELKKILFKFTLFFIEHSLSLSTGILGCYFIFILTQMYGEQSMLSIGNMFATLDLLQYTRISIITYAGYGLSGIFELKVILQRMASIFKIQSSQMVCIKGQDSNEDLQNLQQGEIKMKNFCAFWSDEKPVLQNINLEINQGECISIVGKIGSGKSTLLNCILREIPKYSGSYAIKGKVAYVEQEPYIFSSTIRDNILFGKQFDESFYNEVITVCSLVDDFQNFPNGDQTEIGEKGANLSGGQRARISLARALYSQSDIYLLDDPLSAVDAKVSNYIFNEAIKKFLSRQTVILVTHQIHFTKHTDRIYILQEGQIVDHGTYKYLEASLQELSSKTQLFDESSTNSTDSNNSQRDKCLDFDNSIDLKLERNSSPSSKDKSDEKINNNNIECTQQKIFSQNLQNFTQVELTQLKSQNQTEQNLDKNQTSSLHQKKNIALYTKESSENIKVSFHTYLEYIKQSKSLVYIPLVILFFFTSEGLSILYTNIIGLYGQDKFDNTKLINLLGYITLAYAFNIFIKYFSFMKIQNNCSKTLHDKMIESLVRSKVEYFDTTQSGRIINRFSTDLVIVDQSLPLTSIDALEVIINHISLLVMIIIINPYFLIVAIIQFIFLYYFAKISQPCLIQSKQTDLRNRSPVFNYFTQTVQGILPIRVYNQTKIFQEKFDFLSDNSLRSSYIYWLNSRAFGSYVHILSTLAGQIGIFMLIAINKRGSDIGESIVYFLAMSDCIQWGLRQIIQTDVTMSSTQRILNMCKLEQEPELITQYDRNNLYEKKQSTKDLEDPLKKLNFPSNGKLEFTNVTMKYREGLKPVLNKLSFNIEPGMKVGCIGRTGAGKSSIIQALFRMTEIQDAENKGDKTDIKIDNHSIKNIGLHTLRGGMSIIPQTPFIFSGSIKQNLDPLKQYSDEQIDNCIEEIGLKKTIQNLPDGVNTFITSSSETFSAGQKQLICLGRALLKQSKILVLDEATANLDLQTDEFIQSKIKEKFKNATVLTVAHRLNTIADYDKVLVLDMGSVVEQGEPYSLIQQDNSIFKNMVIHTGKQNSKCIFEAARSAQKLRKLKTLCEENNNQ